MENDPICWRPGGSRCWQLPLVVLLALVILAVAPMPAAAGIHAHLDAMPPIGVVRGLESLRDLDYASGSWLPIATGRQAECQGCRSWGWDGTG